MIVPAAHPLTQHSDSYLKHAGHGSIRSILDDMKLLSTEAEGVNVAIPEADRPLLVNSAGRVGALLGLKPLEPGNQNQNTELAAQHTDQNLPCLMRTLCKGQL